MIIIYLSFLINIYAGIIVTLIRPRPLLVHIVVSEHHESIFRSPLKRILYLVITLLKESLVTNLSTLFPV